MPQGQFHIRRFFEKGIDLFCGKYPASLKYVDDRLEGEGLWKTGDGRKIRVSSMDNWHLYNSIRYLARQGKRCKMLEDEVMKRYELYKRDNKGKLAVLLDSSLGSAVDIATPRLKARNIIRE